MSQKFIKRVLHPSGRVRLLLSIATAILLVLVLFSCEDSAQDEQTKIGTLWGIVYDYSSQAPIQGVAVFGMRNQVSDTTDSVGAFRLDSPSLGIDTFMVVKKYYDTLNTALNVIGELQEEDFFLNVNDEIGCIPVEDTGRVYLRPIYLDTMHIYPKALYVQFSPWVTDTNDIKDMLDHYPLRIMRNIFGGGEGAWSTGLCITDSGRAECHFTPYGKESFNNFGADPMVEYAFGIFNRGYTIPTGYIRFKFVDGTSETTIDSLFNANGLRFVYTTPDYPSGVQYVTFITPQAEKNVLDLGQELQSISFAERVSVEIGTTTIPAQCY